MTAMKFFEKKEPELFDTKTESRFAWLPVKCESINGPVTVWLEYYRAHLEFIYSEPFGGIPEWVVTRKEAEFEYGCGL